MSARSPLICSAVELWYKKMLKIGSLSELTGIDTKIKVAGFQRLYSKWLWLLMAVYKPLFADAIRKRSLDLSPFQITYLHSLIKKISKHLPLYKLPSKASGLKYLIISYVDKLFLKQKIQFHISNDLVAYSSYSFKTF